MAEIVPSSHANVRRFATPRKLSGSPNISRTSTVIAAAANVAGQTYDSTHRQPVARKLGKQTLTHKHKRQATS